MISVPDAGLLPITPRPVWFMNRMDPAVVDLVDLFELHLSHCRPPSSSHDSPGMERRPTRRERGVISFDGNVLAVQRVEPTSAQPMERDTHLVMCGTRRQAEHGVASRLAHVGDRIVG